MASALKLRYYQLFAWAYGIAGRWECVIHLSITKSGPTWQSWRRVQGSKLCHGQLQLDGGAYQVLESIIMCQNVVLSLHLCLRKLWGGDVSRVFPPCDTTQLAATVGDREGKEVSSLLA